jgi:hypothetical protein
MAGKGVEHNGFKVFNETNAKAAKVKYRSGAALAEALIKGIK